MNLHEYRADLLDSVKSYSDAISDYERFAFLKIAGDYLVDCEELEEFNECYFDRIGQRNRRLRIDAYSADSIDGNYSFIIAEYSGNTNEIPTLSQTEIDRIFARAFYFVEDAMNGKLLAEKSEPAYGLAADLLNDKKSSYSLATEIRKIRFYLLTDMLMSSRIKHIPGATINTIPVEYQVWDISRFHQIHESKSGKSDIEIDLTQYVEKGLMCLKVDERMTVDYGAYLCVLPGQVLANLYDQYGARLLESNVRAFLSVKGKVNKGIRATILQQPHHLFAFNNGISATASEILTRQDGDSFRITSIKNFQIVNGGQTTASLSLARYKDNIDLGNTYIQMKLCLVNSENASVIIPEISKCSNTQNKVSDADFFANHPFHIRMEKLSQEVHAPAVTGNQYRTHWFYERARGQYYSSQLRMTQRQKDKFVLENPKNQIVSKTDFAKYYNTWNKLPCDVSKGAQKNFIKFADIIAQIWEKNDDIINTHFFTKYMTVAIMFKKMESLISKQAWYEKGYRANVITYTLARFSLYLDSIKATASLSYKKIWVMQDIPEQLAVLLLNIAFSVNQIITDSNREVANVTEYCKRLSCWEKVKIIVVIPDLNFNDLLLSKEEIDVDEKDAKSEQRVETGINFQIQVVNIGAENWKCVFAWLEKNSGYTPKEKDIIRIATRMEIDSTSLPSEKQSEILMNCLKKAVSEGFVLPAVPPGHL